MLPPHIKTPDDLETSHRATVDGFIEQANQKSRLAAPYIIEAKQFAAALNRAADIDRLQDDARLRDALLAAAGLSDKAINWLSAEDRDTVLQRVLASVAESSGKDWREHVLYRFLLTRGDSLGGSMRNVTGAAAGQRLVDAVTAALRREKIEAVISRSPSGKSQAMQWANRILLFDKRPDFLGKNVDAILLDVNDDDATAGDLIERPECFLACGELKGGIDPAGADEHWKTANSALARIRQFFRYRGGVDLFFVGAAIEDAMAKEIFAQLRDGRLAFAANLTVQEQLADLADWLVGL